MGRMGGGKFGMNGILKYTKGVAVVPVFFPENKVSCQYCPFCKYEDRYYRYSCRLTTEWLLDFKLGVGEQCPLIFEEEEK